MGDNWTVCGDTFTRATKVKQELYGGYLSEVDGDNRRYKMNDVMV